MGFTDSDYEAIKESNPRMSDENLYKQAGNSIVVNVLCQIMQNLHEAMPHLFYNIQVGSFFSGIGAFEKALSTMETTAVKTQNPSVHNSDLVQIGYINDYNGDANRIYDNIVARTLKAEAGGGGAKTGWYCIDRTALFGLCEK